MRNNLGNCFFVSLLVRRGAGDAGGDDAVADGIELLMGGLEEALGGRLAVDGVDHHLLGLNRLHRLQPRIHECVACIVNGNSPLLSLHKHGLDDHVPLESLQPFDDLIYVVGDDRLVYLIYLYGIDGVEFLDVIVNPHQGIVHFGVVDHRGIAQYRHLCLRTILVS